MPRRSIRPWVLLAATLGCAPVFAGTADVQFVDPDRFTDAGRAGWGDAERQRTLDVLARQFATLARALPQDQTLHVSIRDVDLAGELRPAWRAGHVVRVLKGAADAPRLQFSYELQRRDGHVLARGDERLLDLAYLQRAATVRDRDAPLAYEQRMLAEWFGAKGFGSAAQRQ